MYKRSRNLSTE